MRQQTNGPIDGEAPSDALVSKPCVDCLVWSFVALGAAIRVIRYALRSPLMVDECMLAESFLDCDWLEILSPLAHYQMAPPGFLWVELALVKTFGFSEWSLRIYPLACGIGSLVLFRHFASRILSGLPLVLAVGCLAVAKMPIGLSTDAKPYASDLMLALVLLILALEWLRRPDRTGWLWGLAVSTPLVFALSFPAVFVAGAVSVGLFVPLWRLRNQNAWGAWLVFNALIVASFAAVLWLNSGPQFEPTRAFMHEYWKVRDGFPPLAPGAFMLWLIDVHLGDRIFTVPFAAENGGGLVACVFCVVGALAMYRRGQRTVITMFLATFGLTLLAAAFRRYPYAGHARLIQFLVPALAVTCGLGAATILSRIAHSRLRRRMTTGAMLLLALFGVGVCGDRLVHPFDNLYDEIHRDFARRFWRDEPGTVTICALSDLGRELSWHRWNPYFRCNQRIYSPQHRAPRRVLPEEIQRISQPIRLVVYRPRNQVLVPRVLAACLEQFEAGFEPAGRESHVLPMNREQSAVHGTYDVYRFTPRDRLARVD